MSDVGAGDEQTRNRSVEGLSLYGYLQCPYCARVLGAAERLGIALPLRNTMQDPAHRNDLLDAMGRGTVPVLRIEHEDGRVEWLPESADIVDYLVERFAD